MFKETSAIVGINLRSIPQRWVPSLVIVVGLAGVVAVFTALLAMAEGFRATVAATGRNDVAIVLRGGSSAELNSGLTREAAQLIAQGPGIRRDSDNKPIVSAELIVIAELLKRDVDSSANITVRGVHPRNGFLLRPNLKITDGRAFEPGLRELVVGRGVTQQFDGAQLGETVRMRGSDWRIVGIFDSHDGHDSELWADADVAQSTFARQGYSSVSALLETPASLKGLADALNRDPRLAVDVEREVDYYSAQTKQFRATIGVLAGVVTLIMGLGAVFAALNTMYAAVAARAREIATLRAIGFGGLPVVTSVLLEALLLSLIGGAIGAAIAYVLFNNVTASTLGSSFTQIVFSFRVTPGLVLRGLMIAVIVGMVGGLLPAIRAARLPVTTALRAL
ncbi:MAG: ABC transporter permease [Steroidobacteraceae bacterium]